MWSVKFPRGRGGFCRLIVMMQNARQANWSYFIWKLMGEGYNQRCIFFGYFIRIFYIKCRVTSLKKLMEIVFFYVKHLDGGSNNRLTRSATCTVLLVKWLILGIRIFSNVSALGT